MVSVRHVGFLLLLLTAIGVAPAASEDEFPDHGLLPKAETGVDRFLQAHPEYDGRDVVVAIFDTGVDPGAAGLQTTSDGKPKIIDVVDCSGSGDVETSKVRKIENGKVEGLSGRTLTIPKAWKCPKGEVHLGIKRAYELYPRRLVGRLKKKAKKKWDETQRAAVSVLEATVEEAKAVDGPTPEQKKRTKDLELQLEQLAGLSFDDPGPVYDCVVFHDGATWRAALDTDEDGDLADETVLTNYRDERKYGTFSDESLLNYAMNIYDDGTTLSIVVDAGAHGTHVAGIVAAHFPDQPALNGLAPGAQIVAVKIGDTRTGSSSNGTGSIRGLIAALENECDLINMSYGGSSPYPNNVRSARLYTEIVNKHGVIFVASAGNEGPGLSTVGGPGGTTSALFGIGAYLSPSMMKAQYALRKDVPPNYFMWSSRGPTLDGAVGVDFSAPGGAFAPVPTWSLQGQMQMNGTSMSSPNACGGIAVLRSAMKAKGMAYSPHRVRRALVNTAFRPEGAQPYDVGAGIIQIDRAWEYLETHADRPDEDVRYEVTLPRRNDARGVYLREPLEAARVLETRVRVKPHFHEDADHRKRVAYRNRIRLESTQPWIESPKHLLLTHGGETFDIKVDPTALATGVHTGEVRGYDAQAPERGPLFRLPVTVVRPTQTTPDDDHRFQERIAFTPGKLVRRFLAVPQGATWADITLRAGNNEASRVYALQTTQLVPGLAYQPFEEWMRLDPNEEEGFGVKVEGGRTLEVCLSQYWSSHGESTCEIEVRFHGLLPDRTHVRVDGAEHATRVLVTAPFRSEDVSPKAKLTKVRKRYRPIEFSADPRDGDRDLLPEERRIHECVLTYEFELKDDAKIDLLTSLATEDGVWDAHSSSLWMLFDAGGRLLKTGGGGDEDIELDAGTYEVQFQFRHENAKRIEALKQTVLLVDVHLKSPIALGVHPTGEAALIGRPRFESRTLLAGDAVAVFLSAVKGKLPKSAAPGDELIGTITYGDPDAMEMGPGKRPDGFPLRYLVPPKPADLDDDDADDDEEEEDATKASEEAVRDALVKQLAKLRKGKERAAFDKLAARILQQHPKYLPVFTEKLAFAFGNGTFEGTQAAGAVKAADAVVALIDTKALAEHFGVNHDPEDEADQKLHDERSEQKTALIDALRKKTRALSGLKQRAKDYEAAYAALQRWADMDEEPQIRVKFDYEKGHGRLGAALKLLNGLIEEADEPNEKDHAARADLYEALGWAHWAAYERKWNLIRFPSDYPLF